MTDAEKLIRKSIKQCAAQNNVTISNTWRDRRKGPQFISGRTLKLRVLSAECSNIEQMIEDIGRSLGFVCEMKQLPPWIMRQAPLDMYLVFTQ